MTDKYITNLASILTGIELKPDPCKEPTNGMAFASVRWYYSVGYSEPVSHGDETALLFVRPEGNNLIVVVAPADKTPLMKEVCDARGVACHYEIRGGRVVFRCASDQLDRELIKLFNSESIEDKVVFYETPKSADESAQKESSELDFGDLSMFD